MPDTRQPETGQPTQEKSGLVARGLSVQLGGKDVVRDVSLSAPAGAISALLGPNGAGKTTALRALVGLTECAGSIHYGGADLRAMDRLERARTVAYVPQRSLLNAALSVRDVALQGRFCHMTLLGRPSVRDQEAVDRALAETDVAQIADRPYTELSGGEQRRVLLARALATEAPVIVLDEPTASLDVLHILTLFRTLAKLAHEGRVILVVLHDLRDTKQIADRVLLMHEGNLVAQGSTEDVLSAERVRAVYGVGLESEPGFSFRLLEQA